jgi:hypothetical protein
MGGMGRLALIVLSTVSMTGCTVNRPTYSETPPPPAPEVYIIVVPTCTAWHVHDPPAPAACEAPCCREAERLKPRWFE